MDRPLAAESELIAPHWFRWFGVVPCGVAALVVGLAGHGVDERIAGFAVAGLAALAWVMAVVLGAIKVRPRDRAPVTWVRLTRTLIMLVVAYVATDAVPGLRPHGVLLRGTDFVSAAVGGMAFACVVTMPIVRFRSQQ